MSGAKYKEMDLVRGLVHLQVPMPLLKFGSSGKPKFRKFWLSNDLRTLHWTSSSKKPEQSQIILSDIVALKFGQRTEKFLRHRRTDLEHLSFSLVHYVGQGSSLPGNSQSISRSSSLKENTPESVNAQEMTRPTDTLDLVCKDEKDWSMWTSILDGFATNSIDESVLQKARDAAVSNGGLTTINDCSRSQEDSSQVFAWGAGTWGQIGHGDLDNRFKPEILKSAIGSGTVAIACGWTHTLFLMESGTILAAGNRAGTGLSVDCCALSEIQIPRAVQVVQIACGSHHCVARTNTGRVLSWGTNLRGQLGQGDNQDRVTPTFIQGSKDIVNITCGSNSTLLIDASGSLFTCGQGDMGTHGHGHDRDLQIPTEMAEFGSQNPVVSVAAGDCHMLAVTCQAVYSWGWNACGQLGHGTFVDSWTPKEIEMLGNMIRVSSEQISIVDIACGAAHTACILQKLASDEYEMYTWGANSTGQCGHRPLLGSTGQVTANINLPTKVELRMGPCTLLQVECGSYHIALLTETHGLWHAGSNSFHQLGIDGSLQPFSYDLIPVKMATKVGISQVACGGTHTCALVHDSWIEDQHFAHCMACKLEFTRFRRRHHCRFCGGVFCATCSSNKSAVLKKSISRQVRVCDSCYSKLQR